MLPVLIPAALMAVVFFGLAVCRLAAHSDDSHSVPLAEWVAMSRDVEGTDPNFREESGDRDGERYRARG